MFALSLALSASLASAALTYPPPGTVGNPVAVNKDFTAAFQSLVPVNNKTPAKIYTQCIDPKQMALTYDDGPSPFTPKLVEALQKNSIKGTFFVVGSQVSTKPAILKAAVDAKMEIGIHSWTHTDFTTLTNEQIISEVMWTYNIIKDVTGITTKSFRFPFGAYDTRTLNVVQGMGFNVIQWDRDTEDWNAASAKAIEDTFKTKIATSGGHVVLEHDLSEIEVDGGILGMDVVIKANLKPVLLSECLGVPSYGEINGGAALDVVKSTLAPAPSPIPAPIRDKAPGPTLVEKPTTTYQPATSTSVVVTSTSSNAVASSTTPSGSYTASASTTLASYGSTPSTAAVISFANKEQLSVWLASLVIASVFML